MATGAAADPVARYLAMLCTQRQLSPHTIAAYRRDLLALDAALAHPAWAAVTSTDIRRQAARLHAQGLAPRSIARKLSSWRGFFAWLARQGGPSADASTALNAALGADASTAPAPSSGTALGAGLAVNPAEGVRAPRRAKTLPKTLSVDAAVRLVAGPASPQAAPAPAALCDRAMFELLYSSGLRVAELAGLDLHYVKAEAGRPASLGWLDAAAAEVVVTGKGGKMRKVPVGSHALTAIAAWLAVRPPARDGGAALFLSGRASRITTRVVQLRLQRHALRDGGGQHVHPHMLRHSFASHVLQSSGDLRAVQEMLGHASIVSTQVYTALDFQHLAAVYDLAHPRAKSK